MPFPSEVARPARVVEGVAAATGEVVALERARAHLLSLQHLEGCWEGELETNGTMDLEDLLLREFLGIRDRASTKRAGAVPRRPRGRGRRHARVRRLAARARPERRGPGGAVGADSPPHTQPRPRRCVARAGGIRVPGGAASRSPGRRRGLRARPAVRDPRRRARRALALAGVEVRLRRGATAIVPEGGGFRVEVNTAPTLGGDAVVLTVSHDRAARLLPAGAGVDPVRLARLGRSPIVNLHVVYDRRVLAEPFAAGVHTPVQWIFDRSASAGLDAGQYLVVSLSAAEAELDMTVEDLRARYLRALAELLPAAAGAGVETFFVTRDHAATFRAVPGARALRPGLRTAIPGLVLAGSWTDTGWPATMEGAVRSGRAAALEALAAVARKPESAHEGETPHRAPLVGTA